MATDDFFRARLDQMIDFRHPLVVLAGRLPWAQIEAALAPAFARKNRSGQVMPGSDLLGTTLEIAGAGVSAAGRPRLPIRLMAALLYLKHAFNLSDEELVARWSENVVWQYFSGQAYYTPTLPCDANQIGRFRIAIGEAGVEELLKATIETAVQTKAVRPAEFERVIVDTTVQEKAIQLTLGLCSKSGGNVAVTCRSSYLVDRLSLAHCRRLEPPRKSSAIQRRRVWHLESIALHGGITQKQKATILPNQLLTAAKNGGMTRPIRECDSCEFYLPRFHLSYKLFIRFISFW
jgi:hypothetical protein